jgi:hypothetical protein
MTETPVEAFKRIRKQRCDKLAYLAALLGCKTGASVYGSLFYNRVPECWLDKLPPEYVQPIIIAKVREHVAEIDRLWGLSASLATGKPADGVNKGAPYPDMPPLPSCPLAALPVDFP